MQDPDGIAAFCHHNMTNVSFNPTKLEGKYRPSYNNELNAIQINKISFAEDSLDLYNN